MTRKRLIGRVRKKKTAAFFAVDRNARCIVSFAVSRRVRAINKKDDDARVEKKETKNNSSRVPFSVARSKYDVFLS